MTQLVITQNEGGQVRAQVILPLTEPEEVVVGNKILMYDVGKSLKLTIEPNENYEMTTAHLDSVRIWGMEHWVDTTNDHQLDIQYTYVVIQKVILNYTSTPLNVEATINGTLVPSGSLVEFNQDTTVDIEVPPQVVNGANTYLFSHFLVNGETRATPTISIIILTDISIQAVYTLEVLKMTLNYTSSPITVDALIDGVALASGSSLEVDQGAVVTISVPHEVEV